MQNLVTKVLVQTFEEKAGKFQIKASDGKGKALKVTFNLRVDYEKEEGYRQLEVVIYGPMNYVGVYAREKWTVISIDDLDYNEETEESFVKAGKDYAKGESEWKRYSYHDSGWRTDGIDRILREYRDKIDGFNGLSFYEVIDVPEELAEMY